MDGRERLKEITAAGNREQPVCGLGRTQCAERLHGMEPDVRIGIIERAYQSRDRAAIAALPENQRRLDPQIDIVFAQERDDRLDDIDFGGREEIEHAAEDVEIVVLFPKRLDEGVDDGGAGAREFANGGVPRTPVLIAEPSCQLRRGAFALGARRDVFDGDRHARDAPVFPHGTDRDALAHMRRRGRGSSGVLTISP